MSKSGPSSSRDMQARPGEVYLEMSRIGNMLKVSAIDAATGLEVFATGPLTAREEDIQRIALTKLKRRLSEGS